MFCPDIAGINLSPCTLNRESCTNKDSTFGFPPRIMSVPLPAIFVEIVMAYLRPACATISASLAAY